MPIVLSISDEDVGDLNKKLGQGRETSLSSVKQQVSSYLKEMGITEAEVSFIKRDGRMCFGSYRIPFLVKTGDNFFVVKSYENSKHEHNILNVVEGKLAPKVLYWGKDFYAEELIGSNAISLDTIADSGNIASAIELGAKMHSELSKLSINYGHNHWLDEFHLLNERTLITDFGSAYNFLDRKQLKKQFSEDVVTVLHVTGLENCFDYFEPIPCFDKTRPKYQETKNILLNLGAEDLVKKINLWYVLRHSAIGLKRYFESRTHGVDSWDRAMEVFPAFVDYFSRELTKV